MGSKGREHTAKQEGKVRDCSKLTTLFVMELKKNGPRHRQTKGPNKKTTVESFFSGKMGRQYHSSVVDHLVVSPSEKSKKLSQQS